jgi:hypothetical protein
MRTLTLLCALCLTFSMAANAQTAADKALDGLYKAEKLQSTTEKFKGLFGKKKTKTETPAPAVAPEIKSTLLTVTNIDFATLKTLNENIRACSGVETSEIKYGSPSTIKITHSGTTEALMKLVLEVSKDIFTDKNISDFEEGKVTVKI